MLASNVPAGRMSQSPKACTKPAPGHAIRPPCSRRLLTALALAAIYASASGRLVNPHYDVGLLKQGTGLEVVTASAPGLGALTRAVDFYARRATAAASPDAIGFIYDSGHGASDGSTDYLIRVDAKRDRDTVRKFGLVGTWAVDCSKRPSTDNTYKVYTLSETGYPLRTWYRKYGDRNDPAQTFEMRNLQMVGPDRLAYLDVRKSDGDLTNVVLVMIGNRVRSYQAIDPKDGKLYIEKGKLLDSGKPTELFQKCSARSERKSGAGGALPLRRPIPELAHS